MRCDSLLSDGIHTLGAYLYLYPAVLWSQDRCVQALVAIALRYRDPVLESLGVRAIHIRYDGVDLPADLTLTFGRNIHDDADGKDIVYIFKGELLELVADGADTLDASLHLKGNIL